MDHMSPSVLDRTECPERGFSFGGMIKLDAEGNYLWNKGAL